MKKLLVVMGIVFLIAGLFYACGGGGGKSASTGTAGLFVTDDISDYLQVEATVTKVQLVHTGSGTECTLYDDPVGLTIDIANLSDTLQFVKSEQCPARSYNRARIEFLDSVYLMDQSEAESECTFTSYKDHNNQPNILTCENSICSVDINGAVNVLANTMNPVILDFDLHEFEVTDFGTPSCTATMKVEPYGGDDFDHQFAGYKQGVTGIISNLPDPPDGTFQITTKWGQVFTVDYSNTSASQPDLYTAFQLAVVHGLMVRVKSDSIDLSGITPINATAVYVKASGTLTGLDTGAHLFNLSNPAMNNLDISVDYSDAAANNRVQGTLDEKVWIEVKLFGYQSPHYLAHEVEVETMGSEGTDE